MERKISGQQVTLSLRPNQTKTGRMTAGPLKLSLAVLHFSSRIGLAAGTVRDLAENRARHKLANAVRRKQPAGPNGRGPEVFSVERQKRQDDRETQDIDQDNEKDGTSGDFFIE